MANETYDETIGRLREEYQLELEGIEDKKDLEKAFEKLAEGSKPESKKNLLNNVDDFFKESEGVLSEVANTAISGISTTDSFRVVSRLQKSAEELPSDIRDEVIELGEERKDELRLESAEQAIKDVGEDVFIEKSATNSKSNIGFGLTTQQAQDIREKVRRGEDITIGDVRL